MPLGMAASLSLYILEFFGACSLSLILRLFAHDLPSMMNTLRTILLLFAMLYCLIPFEAATQTLPLVIRLVAATLIAVYAWHVSSFKRSTIGDIALAIVILAALGNVLFGFSLRFFVFLVAVIFGYITANAVIYSSAFHRVFVRSIKALLLLSMAGLVIQLATYIFTGKILLLHEIVYPMSRARLEVMDGLVRFGGIYIEPGTYANFMYMFLLAYMVASKDMSSWLIYACAISIVLTGSVWGMVFGAYLLAVVFLANISPKKLYASVPLAFFSGYTLYLLSQGQAMDYLVQKMQFQSESGHSKVVLVNEFLQRFQEYIVAGDGFEQKICQTCASPQDAGLMINMILVFGILFATAIFLVLLYSFISGRQWVMLVSFLPVLLSKAYYWDFVVWLLFFLIVFRSLLSEARVKSVCYARGKPRGNHLYAGRR